jgi:hypothetical protein
MRSHRCRDENASHVRSGRWSGRWNLGGRFDGSNGPGSNEHHKDNRPTLSSANRCELGGDEASMDIVEFGYGSDNREHIGMFVDRANAEPRPAAFVSYPTSPANSFVSPILAVGHVCFSM